MFQWMNSTLSSFLLVDIWILSNLLLLEKMLLEISLSKHFCAPV